MSKANDSFYIRDFILTNKYIAPVVDVITDNTDNGVTVEDFVVADKHKHKIVHVLNTTIEPLTIEDIVTPVRYKAPTPNIQNPSLGKDSLTVEDFAQHTLTHKQ